MDPGLSNQCCLQLVYLAVLAVIIIIGTAFGWLQDRYYYVLNCRSRERLRELRLKGLTCPYACYCGRGRD
jgi:hypothetical protein